MFGGPTLLFRLEVGVLASGLVCGMIEVPGAPAVQGNRIGTSPVLKMSSLLRCSTQYPAWERELKERDLGCLGLSAPTVTFLPSFLMHATRGHWVR